MTIEKSVQEYFQSLCSYNSKTDNEHTHRTPLENFLGAVCKELNADINPRQEVKDGQAQLGVPDFSFIHSKTLGTVGLLENKAIGADIKKLVASAQVKKYRKRNENIILTNYHDWLLLQDGKIMHEASLGSVQDIKGKALPSEQSIAALRNLLGAFLTTSPKGIGRTKELAEQLALRCHDLREFLTIKLKQQKKAKADTRLVNMYAAFQQYVDSHLTEEDFADAFSQTLGYSLFLAKLEANRVNATEKITLYNVQQYIPTTFGLIRSLSDFLKELREDEYLAISYRIQEILGMMNNLHLDGIINELAGEKQLELDEDRDPMIARDPFIYFYEHFLKEYDAEKRKDRGVYYTPPSVVHFIIKSINHILKQQFNIADGLADPEQVQLLDFATGTGTFLHEALQQMFEEPDIAGNPNLQKTLVRDHILKNFYGFEYLIAPYTIAHLKLSQFLRDKGFEVKEPLQILLTNTLDSKDPTKQGDFPFMQKLKEESKKAHDVKEMPIRVIVGNPPYSGASQNKGDIDDLTKDAYAPTDEKKMNWDDYVKFIRFAHSKMEKMDRGVIGVITNNTFLNAITLRQMRNRLMQDFNGIYILNLHGNSNIGELAPDGKPDKNVFDIRVGVCITFLVKTELKPKKCDIFYAAIKSSKQKDKWRQVLESDMNIFKPLDVEGFNQAFAKTRWSNRFEEAVSLFVPMDDDIGKLIPAYGDFWGVTDIFEQWGSGVKTERDYITIHQTKDNIKSVVDDFLKLSESELDLKYQKPYNKTDSRDWSIAKAKADIEKHISQDLYADILYRPFDLRKTYYTGTSRGFIGTPGAKIGSHMLALDNVGLMACRLLVSESWQHILATNCIAESSYLSTQSREFGYHFPLYLYPFADSKGDMFSTNEKQENFEPAFRAWLDKKYGKKYTPEQVLGYIYGVLYSPTFRSKYEELLKIDFPRIPFVDTAKQFEALSALGWELIEAHLMKKVPEGTSASLQGEGNNKVEYINYVPDTQQVHINNDQYFTHIPPDVWHFTIGGYPVLDKYLKERKKADRALGLQELKHIPKVARILKFTITQMQKIDEAWKPQIILVT